MSLDFGTCGSITVDGSGIPELAPDLTFPSSLLSTAGYVSDTGIDATAGLTTVLSLTGKHKIDAMWFDSMTNESITVVLTVDGVVIWNDTFVSGGTSLRLFGGIATTGSRIESMLCLSSLTLQIQTTADNSISFNYAVRPIL